MKWQKLGILASVSAALVVSFPLAAAAHGYNHDVRMGPEMSRYSHHPHVGLITKTSRDQITVQYPIDSAVPERSVTLQGAYLRAGFYPVSQLPFQSGQRVLVLAAQSAHPTVMLLPEARGILQAAGGGWSLTTQRASIPLAINRPQLLGGGKLANGTPVEVFGQRTGRRIAVSILAGTPHIARAIVTKVHANQMQLRTENGTAMAFTIQHLPADWAEHLTKLPPNAPVLAMVSPQGVVLGVMPMKDLWGHRDPGSHPAPTT